MAAHRGRAARGRHRVRRMGGADDPVLRRRHSRVRLALVPPPMGGELRSVRNDHRAAVHRRRVPHAVLSRHRRDAPRTRNCDARARHAVAGDQPRVARPRAARGVLHRPTARRRRRHRDRRRARDGNDDDGLLPGRERRQRRGRAVLPARGGGAAHDRPRASGGAGAGGDRWRPRGRNQADRARAGARADRRRGGDRPARPPARDRRLVARTADRRRRLLVRAQPDRGREPAPVDGRRWPACDPGGASPAAQRL